MNSLFDDFDGRDLPPHNGTPTSVAAAEAIKPTAATLREEVYLYVLSQGEFGAIREEIEHGTGLAGNTVRPRVRELCDAGRLRETTVLRKTTSGRDAAVLVAVPKQNGEDRMTETGESS